MHPLLAQQLQELCLDADASPAPWQKLLRAVSETYAALPHNDVAAEPPIAVCPAAADPASSLTRDELEARVSQRTAALHHAMELAEAANRAKSVFLANMSHEIRTPMSAILGIADMLLTDDSSRLQRLQHVQTLRHQGEHLLSILNDVLDFSKIEANKLETEQVACDLFAIVGDVLSLVRGPAAEKQLRCEAVFAGPLPVSIQTDPTRLRQILINLVGNAVKFTSVGGVQMIVSMAPRQTCASATAPTSGELLRFEVVDSGIGINADQLSALFEPFAQGDSSTTRRYGGTGLGLSICKRLAQMLGGDVSATSVPGVGSRFVVEIEPGDLSGVSRVQHAVQASDSTVKTAGEHAPEPPKPRLHGRVLLAEDGVHNQRVIRFYLENAGLEVMIVENGHLAVDRVLEAVNVGRPFDVVLMDMHMPELDGYHATAQLRAAGYQRPIIALTANAMSGDRAKCIAAGCDDYLSKPISTKHLYRVISEILQGPVDDVGSLVLPTPARSATLQLRSDTTDPVVARFLPMFIADLPAQIEQLRSCHRAADLNALQEILHGLKGTCGLYGFPAAGAAAANAELKLLAIQAGSDATLQPELKECIDLLQRIGPIAAAAA